MQLSTGSSKLHIVCQEHNRCKYRHQTRSKSSVRPWAAAEGMHYFHKLQKSNCKKMLLRGQDAKHRGV